jgi:predicted nucleic-acid-binding protein
MDPYYTAGFVLMAAAVATLVRLEDWPPTEWSKDEIASIIATFIGSTVTVVFFAWFFAETAGLYIDTIAGFFAIVMAGAGGVASIRAILAQAVKTPEE